MGRDSGDLSILMKIKDWASVGDTPDYAIIERLAHARTRMQTPFFPGGSSEQDPSGLLERIRSSIIPRFGPDLLPQRGNYAISRDGRVLAMSVIPAASPFNIVSAHHTVRHLERRVKGYLKTDGASDARRLSLRHSHGRHEAVTQAVRYVQRDLKYLFIVWLSADPAFVCRRIPQSRSNDLRFIARCARDCPGRWGWRV